MKAKCIAVVFSGFIVYIVAIWAPYLNYSWVPESKPVSLYEISSMRSFPEKRQLQEIVKINDPAPRFEETISPQFAITLPSQSAPDSRSVELIPFASTHPTMGNSSTQLAINSLGVVHLLIKKYEQNNNPVFMENALDYTLAFANWDNAHKFSDGLNNNDHAVASRSFGIVKLWLHYREADSYSPTAAQKLIEYAQYLAAKLENEAFYTYYSNHGSMQNVALMLLGTTFQALPNAKSWFVLGKSRLEEQLGYLLSDDGFFLEHSFGYQVFFIDILRTAKVLDDVHPDPVSETIEKAHQRARALLHNISHDGGTLPAIGDTYSTYAALVHDDSVINRRQPSSVKLFSSAGIAKLTSWRDSSACSEAQTNLTIVWSRFKHHAHYRANTAAIDLFDCKTQWWRASGYVPAWHFARATAEGWMGANGPHLKGEDPALPNSAEPVGLIDEAQLQFLQIRRRLPQRNGRPVALDTSAFIPATDYLYRGVYIFSNISIIVDQLRFSVDTPNTDALQVFWTMSADKRVRSGAASNTYIFSSNDEATAMFTRFISNQNLSIQSFTAEPESVLGWVQQENKMLPTTTLKTSIPSTQYATLINASIMMDASSVSCEPLVTLVKAEAQGFSLEITGCGLNYRLTHEKSTVVLETSKGVFEYPIASISSTYKQELRNIEEKTTQAINKYSARFKPLYSYRIKVTLLGGVMLLITLLFVNLSHRFGHAGKLMSVGAAVLWLVMPLWVYFIYLG